MAFEKTDYFMHPPELDQKLRKEQIPGGNPAAPDADFQWLGWYPLWEDNVDKPDEYYTPVKGDYIFNSDLSRVEQTNGWESWPNDSIVAAYKASIEEQRLSANVFEIDLAVDPARAGLMEEANSQANKKLIELDELEAEGGDLHSFNTTLDPQDIGAVDASRSLLIQANDVLVRFPELPTDEVDSLNDLKNDCTLVIQAGDQEADLPVVATNNRRYIGVAGEGYGFIRAKRQESGGFHYIQWALKVDRELTPGDYWIAYYSNDTYLATAQLTLAENGLYETPLSHPQNNANTPYEYTLCYQHVSQEQFKRIELDSNRKVKNTPIRWGGNTSGTSQPTVAGKRKKPKGRRRNR